MGHQYYAIGNTFGYDVVAGNVARDASQCPSTAAPPAAPLVAGATGATPSPTRVLLAAAGDVRNLFATLGGFERRGRVEFVVNDGNVSMLARNAVLLHMAAELDAPHEAVLAVWASHTLCAAHAQLLRDSLSQLAEGPWPGWLSASRVLDSRGGSGGGGDSRQDGAEEELRRALRAWASCTTTAEDLLAQRKQVWRLWKNSPQAGSQGNCVLIGNCVLMFKAVR